MGKARASLSHVLAIFYEDADFDSAVFVENAAKAAAAIGEVTAVNVMPRPVSRVGKIVSRHDIDG